MRKYLTLLLILAALVGVTACGKDGAPQDIPYGQKAKPQNNIQ